MKKLLYILLFFGLTFSSCNYLDVVPENDIETIPTVFEERQNASDWLKTCHTFLPLTITSVVEAPAFTGSDEIVGLDYIRQMVLPGNLKNRFPGFRIADGLQTPLSPFGDVWKNGSYYTAIRYCNIFIENIGNVFNLYEGEKELWTAEIKAIKAHYYFELLRRYGPFIIVDQNIDVSSDVSVMQQPRSSIDDCVNAIVKLLDEAMIDLPLSKQKNMSRLAYHSRESAATLKALTLLYAASPLFNGNDMMSNFKNREGKLLFPAYDKEKWKKAAEAADEAIALCEAGEFELTRGTQDQPTKLLNTMRDLELSVLSFQYNNKEAILMFRNQRDNYTNFPIYTLNLFQQSEKNTYLDTGVKGGMAPSIKAVEMYYTEHGLPINEDKQWLPDKYTLGKEVDERYQNVIPLNTPTVLNLHRRREPRFYSNIAADRTYWYRKQQKGSIGVNITVEATPVNAYQSELFGSHFTYINTSDSQNPTGYWMKKHTNSEFPFKTYFTDVASMGERGAVIFRLPELYLASAEAWNEYLDAPNDKVYDMLDVVRERAGIPKVREAWETYAKNPEKVKNKVGMREIIRQEWNIEFMFEGRRFYNMRRWLIAHEEMNEAQLGWNILGKNAQTFYNNFEGPVVVWSKRKFVAPRDYFFPIRSEEIMISGCVQNPGW